MIKPNCDKCGHELKEFGGSDLYDYVSDKSVIEYFFPKKHDND